MLRKACFIQANGERGTQRGVELKFTAMGRRAQFRPSSKKMFGMTHILVPAKAVTWRLPHSGGIYSHASLANALHRHCLEKPCVTSVSKFRIIIVLRESSQRESKWYYAFLSKYAIVRAVRSCLHPQTQLYRENYQKCILLKVFRPHLRLLSFQTKARHSKHSVIRHW